MPCGTGGRIDFPIKIFMNDTEILSKIQTVFSEILEDDNISISEETSPETLEEWDSFAHIQIVLALEKAFGIKFSSKEVFEWQNVGDILNSIAQKSK